ncbi:hypothetical protein HPP92_008739 [Vanilla planifolia]|uniref:Uncharacterized protein n=1 Tax=Vanilla planifolia TaxID=51239 RepID=A0A835V5N6_VANPL|nr:hypothetical protein HPP92_008739 [Vanilla planifolia]
MNSTHLSDDPIIASNWLRSQHWVRTRRLNPMITITPQVVFKSSPPTARWQQLHQPSFVCQFPITPNTSIIEITAQQLE